jgi:hypothetical protein
MFRLLVRRNNNPATTEKEQPRLGSKPRSPSTMAPRTNKKTASLCNLVSLAGDWRRSPGSSFLTAARRRSNAALRSRVRCCTALLAWHVPVGPCPSLSCHSSSQRRRSSASYGAASSTRPAYLTCRFNLTKAGAYRPTGIRTRAPLTRLLLPSRLGWPKLTPCRTQTLFLRRDK